MSLKVVPATSHQATEVTSVTPATASTSVPLPSVVASTTVLPQLTDVDDICASLVELGVSDVIAREAGVEEAAITTQEQLLSGAGCRFTIGEVIVNGTPAPTISIDVSYMLEPDLRFFWNGSPFDQLTEFAEEHQGRTVFIAGHLHGSDGYTITLLQPQLGRGILVGVAIDADVAADRGFEAQHFAVGVMTLARTSHKPSGPIGPAPTTTTSTIAPWVGMGDEPVELRSILTMMSEASLTESAWTSHLAIPAVVDATLSHSGWLDLSTLTGNFFTTSQQDVLDVAALIKINGDTTPSAEDLPRERWSEARLVDGVYWASPIVPIDPMHGLQHWWGLRVPNRETFDIMHLDQTLGAPADLQLIARGLKVMTGRSVDPDGTINFDVAGRWFFGQFGFAATAHMPSDAPAIVSGRVSVAPDMRSLHVELDMAPYWVDFVTRFKPEVLDITRSMRNEYTLDVSVLDAAPGRVAPPCAEPTEPLERNGLICPVDPASVVRP